MLKTALFSWIMLPVYLWQGVKLRAKIERLLPAPVANEGRIDGEGDTIRLLVIGDSTIASVGMQKLEETFSYAIAQQMHKASGRPVIWRAAGGNSATCAEARDHIVPHIEPRDWTHVVLSIGTNDMKNFHLVNKFKKDFGTLLYVCKTRFTHSRVFWTQIPDMEKFPALPRGLGRVLAARADLINAMGAQLCNERGAISVTPVQIENADGFARDGFHPNGIGYRLWAEHIVHETMSDLLPNSPQNVHQLHRKL